MYVKSSYVLLAGRGVCLSMFSPEECLLSFNSEIWENTVLYYLCISTFNFQVRDLVPESQAYMDLLAFERKLDATIMRKRLEIQELLRRPLKEKRKLRVFISHHFFTAEPESGVRTSVITVLGGRNNMHCVFVFQEGPGIPQWELKIEGVLLEEVVRIIFHTYMYTHTHMHTHTHTHTHSHTHTHTHTHTHSHTHMHTHTHYFTLSFTLLFLIAASLFSGWCSA